MGDKFIRYMKSYGLFFALLYACLLIVDTTSAQNSKEDSLVNSLPSLNKEDKFKAIFDLAQMHYGTHKELHYIDMMEQHGHETNDAWYVNAGLMLRATYYYNVLDYDSFFPAVEIAITHALDNGYLDRYFNMVSYKAQAHILQGNYQTALRDISVMLEKAKENENVIGEINALEAMGECYSVSGRYQEAVEPFNNCLKLLNENFPPDKMVMYRVEISTRLMSTYMALEEYENLLKACEQSQKIIDDFEAIKHQTDLWEITMDDSYLYVWSYRAIAYTHTGALNKAREALDIAEKYFANLDHDTYKAYLYTAKAIYNDAIGEHGEALAQADTLLAIYKDTETLSSYLRASKLRSGILANMNQYKEAYEFSMQTEKSRDSLSRESLLRQISELHTIYQVDQLKMEASIKDIKYRNRLILFLSITLLSLIGMAIIWYQYSKKRAAYKELVLKSQAWAADNSRNISITVPENEAGNEEKENKPEPEDLKIMSRAHDYIMRKKIYRSDDLTLDSLAGMLDITRANLSRAINRTTNDNFNQFINQYRIKESVQVLSDRSNNRLSIDTILEQVGFKNRMTFYQAFKKFTGLSPAEFRKNAYR